MAMTLRLRQGTADDYRTGVGGGQGDACTEGTTPTARAAVNFMPDGNYEDDALCSWFIDCDGTPVSVNMMRLDTEADYDLVTLFDGDSENAPILAEMSGTYMDCLKHSLPQRERVCTSSSRAT